MTVNIPHFFAENNLFYVLSVIPAIAYAMVIARFKFRIYFPTISSGRCSLDAWKAVFFRQQNPRKKVKWVPYSIPARFWLSILSFTLPIGYALESYHTAGCPNSKAFHSLTTKLAVSTYSALNDLKVPFWLMFGNILFVLRSQETLPMSDTDSDVGVLESDFANARESLFNRWDAEGVVVRHLPSRNLVQLFVSESYWGPHSDIWLYSREADDHNSINEGREVVINADYTIKTKKILYTHIFPRREARVLGQEVYLPNAAESIASQEYGESYMTPLTTRLECMENVWNGYTFYQERSALYAKIIGNVLAIVGMYWFLAYGLRLHERFGVNSEDGGTQHRSYLPVATTSSRTD